MRTNLRQAGILLAILAAFAGYVVLVIATGERTAAPLLDEGRRSYLTPAAAALLMYSSPESFSLPSAPHRWTQPIDAPSDWPRFRQYREARDFTDRPNIRRAGRRSRIPG